MRVCLCVRAYVHAQTCVRICVRIRAHLRACRVFVCVCVCACCVCVHVCMRLPWHSSLCPFLKGTPHSANSTLQNQARSGFRLDREDWYIAMHASTQVNPTLFWRIHSEEFKTVLSFVFFGADDPQRCVRARALAQVHRCWNAGMLGAAAAVRRKPRKCSRSIHRLRSDVTASKCR